MARPGVLKPPAAAKAKAAAKRAATMVADHDGVATFEMKQPKRTASATSAALRKIGEFKPAALPEAWQHDGYGYVETVGEVGYLLHLKANIVAACNLRLVTITEADELEDTEDPRARRVMRAWVGPRGGQKELKRRAALGLEIAGETYMLATPLPNDGGLLWEFLSIEECRVGTDEQITRNANGKTGLGFGHIVDGYIARLFRSDARFSERADCALRRVLPICREVVMLTQLVDAIAESRLSAGILFVPFGMSFGPEKEDGEDEADDTDDGAEDEDDDGLDPLTDELEKHMSAPVEDRTSSSSLVPLILRGDAEDGQHVRLIDIARQGAEEWARGLREEALGRIAAGLDAPAEIMKGKGGLNDWSAYNVDADFLARHIVPLGEEIAEFVTVAYLRPMLVEMEGLSDDEAETFGLMFDVSPVSVRQDEAGTMRALYDRMEASGDALRRASGAEEGDAPDDDERKRRMAWQIVLADPSKFAPILLPLLGFDLTPDELDALKPAPPPQFGPGPPETGGGAPGAGVETPGEPMKPEQPGPGTAVPKKSAGEMPAPQGPAGRSATVESSRRLVDRLTAAADQVVDRCLERAGARVVGKIGRQHQLRDRIAHVDYVEVCHVLGLAEVSRLGFTIDDLTRDCTARFGPRAQGWVREWLVIENKVDGFTADSRARDVVESLERMILEASQRSLEHPRSFHPNGLRISDFEVAAIVEAASLVLVPA